MFKISNIFGAILLVILISYNVSSAANYPLQIIQPQEGLSTTNRFYKAYPGIEYNVRVAVTGGMFPNIYQLLTAPSGMTIDSNTGEISWPNPTVEGSPHFVTLKVVDAEGSVDKHSWSISVTTNGFRFLDAKNGKTVAQGGTGSVDNPWKTLQDMYEGNDYASKTKGSYSGAFLYFKSGTYFTSDAFIEDGVRMPLVNYYKPLVWMAYPGEFPVLDVSGGYAVVYGGNNNVYVEGFEITNIINGQRKGWQVDSTGNDVTFRNNDFHGMTDLASTNMACIFIARASKGYSWAFLGNKFHDNVSGMGIEAYMVENALVEDNEFYQFRSAIGRPAHAMGAKDSLRFWFIRDNKFWDNQGFDIWINGTDDYSAYEEVDISFNLVRNHDYNMYGYAIMLNHANQPLGKVHVYRNTFVGPVDVRFAQIGWGAYYYYNNVVVNNDSAITCSECVAPSIVESNNNLLGTGSMEIVDENGDLTTSYSSYLGTYGHQIFATVSSKPAAPRDFSR